MPPSQSPTLSILSLAVSPLLGLNFFFLLYWLLRRKRAFLLSAIALLIAYFVFNPFYKFSSEGIVAETDTSLSILSYNVHLFNLYEEGNTLKEASTTLSNILASEMPDIICLQEFYGKNDTDFSEYPYKYIHARSTNNFGHAIYSKYPIVNQGAFDFKKTHNNALFADVLVGTDTVRVYNLHLQSIGIAPSVGELQDEDKERVRQRLSSAFVRQEAQAKEILAHKEQSPYPVLLAGDFNNTPFSYVHRLFSATMQDTFLEKGNGIGTTFMFDFYPMRIDFIFASENLEVVSFNRFKTTFSDHYPIFSKVILK
ncbi:endonuclease/exonuclease/phosphatase family protein [Rasiella rasia]|uniref:Endonuclease/exonuclease/phosphatase family protein n=1 Tax=Rasiella rasia TaxID=2744027 RepID=A0A6G6GI46_9FLAO|nr:endonuclease/exonuclease/phosphatase family protein [Rasiella rasia]QIE58194.1 endonuclease/exonuclease/phosphatase family protein [Rasiella rasia]